MTMPVAAVEVDPVKIEAPRNDFPRVPYVS
jgi:hypothetical protein